MQLTFLGGADAVTGSASLLTDDRLGVRCLIDCGAEAGRAPGVPDGAPPLGFDARRLDFVLLTHAHRDHSGRLPQLHRAGFRGPVYCTEATAWMTRIALLDAAKFSREYSADDVEMIDFQPLDLRPGFVFDVPMRLHGVTVALHRSAHILGAVAATIGWRSRIGTARTIVFSGDIGGNTPDNPYQSLLAGQALPGQADYMVIESTRGAEPARDATYKAFPDRLDAWADLLADSDARGGGPVVAPCFAIHRAQELWFDLDAVLRRSPAGLPDAAGRPRWLALDAPLAARMTEVYAAILGDTAERDGARVWRNPHLAERLGLADETAVDTYLASLWARVSGNRAPGGTLRAMHDPALSRVIALAGSGMAEGGRIVDFITDQIHNPAATIVLCGYAPAETGAGRLRRLAAGEWPSDTPLTLGQARIDPTRVRARIVDFGDYYSGHGDIETLCRFVFERPPEARPSGTTTVFINHGDPAGRAGLSAALSDRAAQGHPGDRMLSRVILPSAGQAFDLDSPDNARRERVMPRLRTT
ncbi:MBL fold metallo-hydrolase [Salinisphaera sp. Q1T1-3]|uniref:MBL fold metallo-hydrolase n=1 Tax=Salinisphaera sp. Q1T1-3 TaxID=2321229 RepID=UPI000E733A4E|nr:MBL fold metallo-hydrolase [Salinisphaera sp. Q1T1-3]RJS91519.1 MBL fold metallo-hydrolase [Salinisphaera sp. Q1T1-3]